MIATLLFVSSQATTPTLANARSVLEEMAGSSRSELKRLLAAQSPEYSAPDGTAVRGFYFREGYVMFRPKTNSLALAVLKQLSSDLSEPMTDSAAKAKAESALKKFCQPRTIGEGHVNRRTEYKSEVTFSFVQIEGNFPHRNTALATVNVRTGDVVHFQYTNPPTVGSIPPLVLTQAQAHNRALAFSESYQIGTQLELQRARGPMWVPIHRLPTDYPLLRDNMTPSEKQWGDDNGAFLIYEFRFQRVNEPLQSWVCWLDAASGKAYFGTWQYEQVPPQ